MIHSTTDNLPIMHCRLLGAGAVVDPFPLQPFLCSWAEGRGSPTPHSPTLATTCSLPHTQPSIPEPQFPQSQSRGNNGLYFRGLWDAKGFEEYLRHRDSKIKVSDRQGHFRVPAHKPLHSLLGPFPPSPGQNGVLRSPQPNFSRPHLSSPPGQRAPINLFQRVALLTASCPRL